MQNDLLKQSVLGIILNVLAGILLFYFAPFFPSTLDVHLMLIISLVLVILTLWFLWGQLVFSLNRRGIIGLVLSMTESKGSTKSILETVTSEFAFMGIAARKWINTGQLLINVVTRVGTRHRRVRFLLLDPDSSEAKRLSLVQSNDPERLPNDIRDSLTQLNGLRKKGVNIDVHLYSFLPLFRIAIVDDQICYVGFYQSGVNGERSPQLILDRNRPITYFQPFQEYFEHIWENSIEPNWDQDTLKAHRR